MNKQKHTITLRFEVTKELEKEFRENKVKPSKQLLEKLHIDDKIYADYITLAQKTLNILPIHKKQKCLQSILHKIQVVHCPQANRV